MQKKIINNDIYNELGEKWYHADDDPVALLRAESRLLGPWVASQIGPESNVLDIGCGGGFLSNALAKSGHAVTGIDLSAESLDVAKKFDVTATVRYEVADANALPFADQSFDVVTCMDFLEHVEDVPGVVKEASRVLRQGGKFFFHTFNRNPASGLIAIRLVEFLVPNTPKNLHLYRMFIKPSELQSYCKESGLEVKEILGVRPVIASWSVLRGVMIRRVPQDFRFKFGRSTLISYAGVAEKGLLS